VTGSMQEEIQCVDDLGGRQEASGEGGDR